jgi:aryl-alcohol dehydrogenase
MLPEKLELACELGATHTVDASQGDPVGAIRDICPDGVDYAFEMTGQSAVITQALDAVGSRGEVIVVGVPPFGKETVDLDVYGMLFGEKVIGGVAVGVVQPAAGDPEAGPAGRRRDAHAGPAGDGHPADGRG